MKKLIGKIPKEVWYFSILMAVVVFLGWLLWPSSPLTQEGAQQVVQQRVRQHCNELKYKPCDYYLVKIEKFNTKGSGIYIFNSRHRKPISVSFFENGEIHLVDDNLYLNANKPNK